MDWEEIKNYHEEKIVYYKLYTPGDNVSEPLIKRIPTIIDPSRLYSTFTIICDTESKIVLQRNYTPKTCKIILNYEYFKQEEIFNIFEIPQIRSLHEIGHIIHLNLEPEHQPYKYTIGNIILSKTNATTVIQKTGINRTLRNIEYELLAGSADLKTWHKENGILFYVDYGNVYWNSKLANERKNLQLNGTVVDPFCGCGAFVLYALLRGCKVLCNDLNPVAMTCTEKNVKNYKYSFDTCFDRGADVVGMNMDAQIFLNDIKQEVDHFIFNLPEYSLDYVLFLRRFDNYTLHCYFFARDLTSAFEICKEKCYMIITEENIRFIRKVAPNKNMYKLTVTINKDL